MSDGLHAFAAGFGAAATSPAFALGAALTAIVVIAYHFAVVRPQLARATRRAAAAGTSGAQPPDTRDLRDRIAALEAAAPGSLRNVGFVRFNAFPDVGSDLSYALAVVDGRGDGFVMSSLYSREEVRTYAKAVKDFAADKELSGEERRAVEIARERAVGSR